MKSRLVKVLMLLLCITLVLSGCGGGTSSNQSNDQGTGDKPLKVALLLSGPANDQGWNAIALAGLVAAEEEYGIETAYMENVDIADTEAAYTDYAA